MSRRSTLLIELPTLSDQGASELLDLLQQLFAALDSHYYAQAARHHRRQREDHGRCQLHTPEPSDPPF